MDSITSALVVGNILRTLAIVLHALQTANQQTYILIANAECQGLVEIIHQSQALWKNWGYNLCLSGPKFPISDQDVLEIQQLIDQTRVLCEAIRLQTPLHQHYSQGLRIGHISERVFERHEIKRPQTIVFEQLRVLGDLENMFESMTKPEGKSSSQEVVVLRRSSETEKTLVDPSIPSPHSSALFSSWLRRVPSFRRHGKTVQCMKVTKIISSDSGLSSELCLNPVCSCPKCVLEATARSRAIDLELKWDADQAKNRKTVLLLGARESNDQVSNLLLRVGKNPYSIDDLEKKKVLIRKQAFADVANQLHEWSRPWGLNYELMDGIDEEDVKKLSDQVKMCEILTAEHATIFVSIWLGFWKYQGRIPHPSNNFLINIKRIVSSSYTPTEEDISHMPLSFSRFRPLPTLLHQSHSTLKLNIVQYHSSCNSNRLLDHFSDTSAIIFSVDLTFYSQPQEDYHPREHYYSNAVNAGISIFSSVVNGGKLEDASIFLWLGNIEKFKSMVGEEKDGIQKFLPGCNAGNDGDKALDFVVERYMKYVKDRQNVFVSFLDVMDVRSVKKAVSEMGDNILTLSAKGKKSPS